MHRRRLLTAGLAGGVTWSRPMLARSLAVADAGRME